MKIPGCRTCIADDWSARRKACIETRSDEEAAADYPATTIGTLPVREEFKSDPPVYWPMCERHAIFGMIAGFKPVWLNTPEGAERLADFNARAAA